MAQGIEGSRRFGTVIRLGVLSNGTANNLHLEYRYHVSW
jgi:hypothetical protein